MYCPNCGAELKDGAQFCGNCGKKIETTDEIRTPEAMGEKKTQRALEQPEHSKDATAKEIHDEYYNGQDRKTDEKDAEYIDKSKLSALDKLAIRFTYLIADPVIGIFLLFPSMKLFSEGGFWGIAFGLIFLILGVGYIISGIKEWIDIFRGKSTIDDKMNKDSLKSCRKTLIIGIIIIVIGIAVIHATGGGIYTNVQSVVLDDFGSESIGTVVDDNIKNAKWGCGRFSGPPMMQSIRVAYDIESD